MNCKHDGTWLRSDVEELLESVTLELDIRPLDLGAMINSVIAGFADGERDRIDHHCRHRITVLGDEARLRFGITNLLRMTLSCSFGCARLTVHTSQQDQRAQISIFAAGRPRDHQWVALDIMRKIAEAHDGGAAVAPLEDVMRSSIVLPAASKQTRRWPTHRTSIMLVDDNIEQVAALAEVLRLDGLNVELATTGMEALERIEVVTPDMLIVDVQLPDLDVASLIMRAREHRPELPVALLTGYPPDHPVVKRAIATTQSAYLAKPVNVDALLELVARAVQ